MKVGVLLPSAACASWLWASIALADPVTPGYPERVLQWTVQEGERCSDISGALYGDAKRTDLIERYNSIDCTAGRPIETGTTLVVPEKITELPTATLRSMAPAVRTRPGGGAWQPASPGMPLHRNDNVNTLDHARADIRFVDRTRVVLAEHTLVVIFGTASQTRVSRSDPSAVQLDEGEVEAGLAALAGRPVSIGVQGGGRVDAASRDTVVRKKPARATVSVFDGQARVQSAGQSVTVPQRYGTSFRSAAPPTPPRPLPPAALWSADFHDGVLLAPSSRATLTAAWQPVAKAVAYRIEVATDTDFHDLITREEVDSTVRSFRAENLPPGAYYLRVRAIDDEDFLGLSTAAAEFTVVGYRQDGGAQTPPERSTWQLNPYGSIRFEPSPGVEVSLDRGPFQALPAAIDLARLAPRHLAFKAPGASNSTDYDLAYSPVLAHIDTSDCLPNRDCNVHVRFDGVDGLDVADRVGPSLIVNGTASRQSFPLSIAGDATGRFDAVVPAEVDLSHATLSVVDRRGGGLGSLSPQEHGAQPQPVMPESPLPRLGVDAPLLPISTQTSVLWWSPTTRSSAYVAAAAARTNSGAGAQAHARVAVAIGRLGLDALLPSPGLGDVPASDSAGWFGGRMRIDASEPDSMFVGTAVRLGAPLASDGPPARLEAAMAAGAMYGRIGWLANFGLRDTLEDNPRRAPSPSSEAFLLAGATYDLAPNIRSWALLDSHLLTAGRDTLTRGGLGLGVEAGKDLFGSAAIRASAWDQAGGALSAQLAFGARIW